MQTLRQQRGVTLIIGLIMLMVLTLLAVSTMRTASQELLMAGNSQARESAFQLAQAGLDSRMAGFASDRTPLDVAPDCPDAGEAPLAPDVAIDVDTLNGRYATGVCFRGEGSDLVTGSSIGKIDQAHYELVADGTTLQRGGRSVLIQGFYVLRPASPE